MLQRTSFFLATSHWARLCHATAATQQYLLASLSNDARREDASIKTKIHVLKCTKAPLSSPISQAVALMLSREQIPLQQLHTSMDLLSQQLLDDMPAYSSTQLAAFTEACRQMSYCHQQAFSAMLRQLAPTAAGISVDELPSLLWAGAQLASATAAPVVDFSSNMCEQAGQGQRQLCAVPVNDGINGSVSSSKIARLPGVVDFLLGAAQNLTGGFDDLAVEELTVVAAALSEMEYRDPFLLTTLAEACIERRAELSQGELVSLIESFAAMGRWFFDNRLLDGLACEVVQRASHGRLEDAAAAVHQVAAALACINHHNKQLQQYLTQQQQQSPQ